MTENLLKSGFHSNTKQINCLDLSLGKRTSAENESWKTAENGGWKMTDKPLENGRQSYNSIENCRQFMENGRKHFLCIGK